MAALPIIPNVYRVAFNWSGPGGETATNVMHFLKTSGTASDLFDEIDAQVTAAMWVSQPASCKITEVVITKLDGTSASQTFTPAAVAKWAGGSGSTSPIPQAAAIVKFVTAKRGRSYRGRVFLPFIGENAQDTGTIGSDLVAEGQTAWGAFLSALTDEAVVPVIASYLHATAEPILTHRYEPMTATQRRRQDRIRR